MATEIWSIVHASRYTYTNKGVSMHEAYTYNSHTSKDRYTNAAYKYIPHEHARRIKAQTKDRRTHTHTEYTQTDKDASMLA